MALPLMRITGFLVWHVNTHTDNLQYSDGIIHVQRNFSAHSKIAYNLHNLYYFFDNPKYKMMRVNELAKRAWPRSGWLTAEPAARRVSPTADGDRGKVIMNRGTVRNAAFREIYTKGHGD